MVYQVQRMLYEIPGETNQDNQMIPLLYGNFNFLLGTTKQEGGT